MLTSNQTVPAHMEIVMNEMRLVVNTTFACTVQQHHGLLL